MQAISIDYRWLLPRRSYLVMNYSWAMSAPASVKVWNWPPRTRPKAIAFALIVPGIHQRRQAGFATIAPGFNEAVTSSTRIFKLIDFIEFCSAFAVVLSISFNMPFLGWLPDFSPLQLQLLFLLRYCQIVLYKVVLYHEMRKAVVIDIELQLAWASFVVINTSGHSTHSFYTGYSEH